MILLSLCLFYCPCFTLPALCLIFLCSVKLAFCLFLGNDNWTCSHTAFYYKPPIQIGLQALFLAVTHTHGYIQDKEIKPSQELMEPGIELLILEISNC